MTFLPSFLLAIVSTLDLTNKKSLSILISHPYLVLLPTFTYFSNAQKIFCGDRRISFSPKLSWVNMLLNAVALPGIFFILGNIRRGFDVEDIYIFLLVLLPTPFTLLFLYLEKISCCSCCGLAGRLVRVFDPEHPEKSLILKEGKVVEVTDLEETVINNTVDNIEDRRSSKEADDEPGLETEKYRLEEDNCEKI